MDSLNFHNPWFTLYEQQDFLPKLKLFLLPKIKDIFLREDELHPSRESVSGISSEGQVYIAGDRFYRHNLMRLNYTTYDIRRAQDIVNPSTSHCNIMLLADHVDSSIMVLISALLALCFGYAFVMHELRTRHVPVGV